MWLYMRLTTMVTVVKGDDAYMMAALHHYEGKSAPEPRKRLDRRQIPQRGLRDLGDDHPELVTKLGQVTTITSSNRDVEHSHVSVRLPERENARNP